ncbi:MAG: hypothetical protein PVI33_01190 [Candidatus Omnitrophota bacterium]|jgi:hypothetical protein
MKRLVLAVLIFGFLVAGSDESLAFWWWERKEEVKQAPVAEEIKKPVQQQVAEEEARRAAEAQEANRLAERQKMAEEEASRKEAAQQELRELKQNKVEELNNTEWQIELSLFEGGKKSTDVITFKDNQVVSANLSRAGFSPTNYTLTVQKNGIVVWETMQTSTRGEIAFWRGEFDSSLNKLRGILSHKLSNKTSRDYYFWSTQKKMLPVVSSEEE